jgi:pyruvate carboxylase subunit B
MMRDNGIMDKYPDLIKAMSDVVRRGGFGTSVTPVSQFYVQQALNNVMFGTWEKIAEPYGRMVLGYFGKTPVAPDPEIVKKAAEQLGLEPTTRAPLDINDEDPNKGVKPARKALQDAGLEVTDENVFIAAACKEKGIAFLKGEAKVGVRLVEKPTDEAATESAETGRYVVSVNGRDYRLAINGDEATVNGITYQVGLKSESGDAAASSTASKASPVTAQMPGVVLRLLVSPGDAIQEGDSLLVLEAMKMEVHINAPSGGIIAEMLVSVGDQVATGQVLASIG